MLVSPQVRMLGDNAACICYVRINQIIDKWVLAVTWSSHDYHMVIWWSHDYHMSHMTITWWSHGDHMTITWLSHGDHMTITSHMTITWLSHESHDLCDIFLPCSFFKTNCYIVHASTHDYSVTECIRTIRYVKRTELPEQSLALSLHFNLNTLCVWVATAVYCPPSLQVWLPDDDRAQGDLRLGEESWWLAVCSFAYLLDLPTHNVVLIGI